MIHDTIKQRLRAALLASTPGKTALDTAARLASELTDDGSWSDLDEFGNAAPGALAGSHLDRTILLARARHFAPGELDSPVRRTLDWWLSRDLSSGDPHRDGLATPRQVGEIALLCEEELSLGAWGKVIEILTRSRWAYWEPEEGWKEWTGAPLLGVAHNVILRGCLEKVPALCETAFRRAFRYTRWTLPDEEGQPAGLDSLSVAPGGDSLSLAQDYARLIALAHGTSWQAPAESIRAFVGYLLDFLQWTMRQPVLSTGSLERPTHGLQKQQDLASAITHFSQLGNPPRREELLALAERLQGHGKPLTGHRSFWRSRVAFHQRPAFYASLRLKTSRYTRQDFTPASAPAIGSTLYFLRDGEEYAGLQDRWNFRQLPGLTAIQRHDTDTRGEAVAPRLIGSVSEGEYGIGALEQVAGGLHARKAWFFLDESVVCLDAGVHGPSVSFPVLTTVNQCRFAGSASAENTAGERRDLTPGQSYDLTATRRVEHGGFLYYFPSPLHVVAWIGASAGGNESSATGAEAVFNLCVDHGLKPAGSNAAYVVLPLDQDIKARDRTRAEIARIEFLSNTAAVQAVGYRGTELIGAAFWEPGVVTLPRGGRIAANRPCLMLCREHPAGGATLNISNLSNLPATVHVEVGGRCLSFDLPGGAESGRSLSRHL